MKVTVIVATYRRDISLKNALASIRAQLHPEIEIIVVDDNADKHWNVVAEEIVSNYESMYICNESNLGSAESRNVGIRAATGDYITFLDDDDVYLPDKVSQQLKHMLQSNADFSLTDIALYNENGGLVEYRDRSYINKTDIASLVRYHLQYHMTGTDAMMFRTSYLRSIGGFSPINVGDEFYLMMNAIERGGVFSYLPRCDIKAYVHNSSGLSSGDSKIEGENLLYTFKKLYFCGLDSCTIRSVKMRHYAVVAYVFIKKKKYFEVACMAILSFICDPIQCNRLVAATKDQPFSAEKITGWIVS